MSKMDILLSLLKEIVKNVELSEDQIKLYADKLKEIYSSDDFRHSYFILSQCIENFSPDQRDILCGHLDSIIGYSNVVFSSEKNFLAKIMKLYDHINLEIIRLGRMDKIKFIGDKASEDRKKAEELLKENHEKVEELQNSVNGFHSQSITILGIFAGLVISFSAISNLGLKTFENINTLNFYKTIFYLLILGLIIFDTIFMLMYTVSKISNHSISVGCKHRDCNDCPQCNNFISKLNHKYPYVLWFNITFIFFIVVLAIFMCKNMII